MAILTEDGFERTLTNVDVLHSCLVGGGFLSSHSLPERVEVGNHLKQNKLINVEFRWVLGSGT